MKDNVVELKERLLENKTEVYFKRYKNAIELLEKSPLSKVRSINNYDRYALGAMCEQFDVFQVLAEEAGNTNLLGKLPLIAYDVLAASYGASILPLICSIQPIEEEQGIVYVKKVRSGTTKGSQTEGDVVVDPRTGLVTPSAYASNKVIAEEGSSISGATVQYDFTLVKKPIRGQTLVITLEGKAQTEIYAKDNGAFPDGDPNVGQLLGIGVSGTVNYVTGEVSILFAETQANGKKIYCAYQQNYELSTDIQKIDSPYAHIPIQAHIYALKGQTGTFQKFALRKRLGRGADEEMAKDLVQELNRELSGDAIRKLVASALGTTSFDKTAPAAVSYFEHKMTYMDSVADAEAVMLGNAGRGSISTLIVGREHAAVIQGLPNFKKISEGQALGAHVFGTLNGMTVIRVPEAALLDPKAGIGLYKGSGAFEAPCVYAPYMPLMMTGILPEAPNPFTDMRGAAVWAGLESVVPQFATNLNIVQTTPSP